MLQKIAASKQRTLGLLLVSFLFLGFSLSVASAQNIASVSKGRQLSPATLDQGLVAYWKLDDANNWADSVGNNNTLTSANGATTSGGYIGNSLQAVRASDQYLYASNNAELEVSSFTLSAWVYLDSDVPSSGPNGPNGIFMIASKETGGTETNRYGFNFGITGDRDGVLDPDQNRAFIEVYIPGASAGPAVIHSTFLRKFTWYLVTAYHNADTKTLGISINGGGSQTQTYTTTNMYQISQAEFRIGKWSNTPDPNTLFNFNGRIDEVGFWNRILTQEEIFALHNCREGLPYPFGASCQPPSPSTGLINGLISYWTMEQPNNVRTDSFGNNDLTPSGNSLPGNASGYKNGNALALNRNEDQHLFATTDPSLEVSSFTLSAWVYLDSDVPSSGPNGPNGIFMIASKETGGTETNRYGFNFGITGDRDGVLDPDQNRAFIEVYIPGASAGPAVIHSTFLSKSTWYLVTAYHNADTKTLGISINGGGSQTQTYTTTNMYKISQAEFRIGKWSNTPDPNTLFNFNGRIDEVGFWNRILTQGEIQALYGDGNGCVYPFTACATPTPTPTPTLPPSSCYKLSVSVQPYGAGKVSVRIVPPSAPIQTGVELSPSASCLPAGTAVTLLVHPTSANYRFSHWSGSTSGTSPSISFFMTSSKNAVANFSPEPTPTAVPGSYEVSGLVLDNRRRPMVNTEILILDLNNPEVSVSARTDTSGHFITQLNKSGRYFIRPFNFGYSFPNIEKLVPDEVTTNLEIIGWPIDKPPVVLVPGWLTDCSFQGDLSSYFGQLDDQLINDDHYVAFAELDNSTCTPNFDITPIVYAMARAREVTGQNKVVIVAYDLGGILARRLIEHTSSPSYSSYVKELFTLGTPHTGMAATPHVLKEWLFMRFGPIAGLPQNCIVEKFALCWLATNDFEFVINSSPAPADITYHIMAGIPPDDELTSLGKYFRNLAPGNLSALDDGLVDIASIKGYYLTEGDGGFSVLTEERYDPADDPIDDGHSNAFSVKGYLDNGSDSYTGCILPVLVSQTRTFCSTARPSQISVKSPQLKTLQQTPIEHAFLLPGQTVTRSLSLEGGLATFASLWHTGTLTVTLNDPNGQLINPAFALANPTVVSYTADINTAVYQFPNALAGSWKMIVQAANVPVSGTTSSTYAAFESLVEMNSSVNSAWYKPGNTAIMTASLSGSPTNVSITATMALASGLTNTVPLLSQGNGLYQGNYVLPNAPGSAGVTLRATGITSSGVPFERDDFHLISIASNSFSLNNANAEILGSSLLGATYEVLTISIGIQSTVSDTLGIAGDLIDANGKRIAHAVAYQNVLTGTSFIDLGFTSSQIFASQANGPYTLTNLVLTERQGLLIVDKAQNIYTTLPYQYTDFASQQLYLPLIQR